MQPNLGPEAAQRGSPTRPRWSAADLTLRGVRGMVEGLWNFSARCLNRPFKPLPSARARSSVMSLRALALSKHDLQIPKPGPGNLSKHSPPRRTCIQDPSGLAAGGNAQALPSPASAACTLARSSWAHQASPKLALSLHAFASLTRHYVQMPARSPSWANSRCLLCSMTCLKWHASLKKKEKKRGDQMSRVQREPDVTQSESYKSSDAQIWHKYNIQHPDMLLLKKSRISWENWQSVPAAPPGRCTMLFRHLLACWCYQKGWSVFFTCI